MITDALLNILTAILNPIIDIIPSAGNFTIPEYVSNFLLSLFRAIGLFLPVKQLLPLFLFVIGLYTWRFVAAIVFRIRGLF